MPTPFESATLILTLYEHRREETMRKARDYVTMFDPQSFEELMAAMLGPDSGYIRMVISYWEQAATFVINGAVDEKMFRESTSEFISVFGKMEPFLPQLREAFGNPGFLVNLEKLTLGLPDARNRIDSTLARLRGMIAKRAAMMANA